MKIAIIGAGFAGLSSAKVLREFGFDVVVHEKAADVGGVWSRSRRYPGVRTQNSKGTYRFSDLKMPRSYSQWPTGRQVQEYLELYTQEYGLEPYLRLNSEVTEARLLDTEDGWDVTTRALDGAMETERFDHVVVANGIFSEPFIPPFEGAEEFLASGNRIVAASEFHDIEDARGKSVIVLGYGKTSCDVAVPISEAAESTTVVARALLWKMPRRLGGVLNYKYLMLTRMGEALFRYQSLHGFEKFLHGPGDAVRRRMLGSVQSVATRQLNLKELGLVPHGTFEDIGRSTVSLVTEGFYERVKDGRITVHRDCVVAKLIVRDGVGWAELSNGETVRADLVVCGTGFRQMVPFFDEKLNDRLTDEEGNFLLYKQIHPINVPNLTFSGYNSSFFSPLSAEMAAVWIASHLLGCHKLPPEDERLAFAQAKVAWMAERTEGHHARGTNIIPFSMHNVDEVLDEINLNVGVFARFTQWLGPVRPSAYRFVAKKLKDRAEKRGLLPTDDSSQAETAV
ncbi:flavin-containing monooxygenase [Janibacter alittae]|uniref:NAD(P)/FAD-dependent oxidoreductase n=1 Tax=Janibacter alittae TaxID=3115209 RepID=A0ABZ2MJP9_9MICO